MPSGKVTFQDAKGLKKQPGISKIFKKFHSGKILKIKAELPKEKQYRWRPQGINTYMLRIHSIVRKNPKERYMLFSEYEAKAVLVGMNDDIERPEHICWDHDGIEYEVTLYFNARGKLILEYQEYLTL